MAKVNFKRINDSTLIDNIEISDGNLIVTKDGGLYVDYENERVPIGGTPDDEMNSDSTNAVKNKVVKEYIDTKIKELYYIIEEYNDWKVIKYDNGLCKMYYKKTESISVSKEYMGTPLNGNTSLQYYYESSNIKFPINLTELLFVNTSLQKSGALTSVYTKTANLSEFSYYVSDMLKSTNSSVTIFAEIVGKWK